MGSLRKRPGSPYWVYCFSDGEGRPTQKSTKQTDRNLALTIGLEWESAAKKGRQGHLTMVQVRKVLSDITEKTLGESLIILPIGDFLTNWVTSKETSKSKGTATRYRHTVEEFLRHLGKRGSAPLNSLVPRDIETFRDLQIKQGKSNGTANMEVKTLRAPLNMARRQGLILTNPAEAVDLLPMDQAIRDVFTLDQVRSLLAICDHEWRGVVLVAVTQGLRLGDIAKLTWGSVDLERHSLKFSPQKDKRSSKKRELEVPLHPDVEAYLLGLPISSKSVKAPLFPALSQKKVGGKTGLSLSFRGLMGKAGINSEVFEEGKTGKGRRFYKLGFHSLRHTFVSLLANQGIAPELRMKLSGHTSEVHQRYTHHELEVLRKSILSIPSLN